MASATAAATEFKSREAMAKHSVGSLIVGRSTYRGYLLPTSRCLPPLARDLQPKLACGTGGVLDRAFTIPGCDRANLAILTSSRDPQDRGTLGTDHPSAWRQSLALYEGTRSRTLCNSQCYGEIDAAS